MKQEDLISQLTEGNITAFEQVFRRYARGMQLVAYSLCKDPDLAKDAVQESFIYLWEHREKIKDGGSLDGYLYASVRNYILNHFRHMAVRQQKEEDIIREQVYMSDEDSKEDWEYKFEIVRKEIAGLPESCRRIFIMTVLEGMGYAEAAEVLGVSTNTVKSQVKIAYKRLRARFGGGTEEYLFFWLLVTLSKKIF